MQAGHGCIGHSEGIFWDNGPFYSRLSQIKLLGVETDADKIGFNLPWGAATMAVHALVKRGI